MKISYNWLKELLPDLPQTPKEVADLLTLHSFETNIAGKIEVDPNIKIVRITKIEPHPNADRLRLVTVSDGEQEFAVVCGAPNIEVGQVVPYSPPGATLKDEAGNDFVVKEATIRGQSSPGMLNSLRELGLHPKEHGGIWILPDDLPLGSSLAEHLPSDVILDADITPNRAHDALSHLGIAREVAALLKLAVKEPDLAKMPSKKSDWKISIEKPVDCPRYIAAEIVTAKTAPSPMWLQARLLAAGGKPKNNLIDITNYVLFEIGNPTHLFDYSTLSGKSIVVRRADAGEKVTALDELEYQLTPDDLVIANHNKPVAIAGIMGGMETGVKDNTENLLLEVATFRPYLIQETSRRLNLRSESSARFSKGIHPAQAALAARRAIFLLQEVAGATVHAAIDVYPEPKEPIVISFRPNQPSKIAGMVIDADEAADILRRLRCQVDDSSEVWQVTVPPDRLDLDAEHDLVEEVVRVIGLANIPRKEVKASPAALPGAIYFRDRLRDNLVALGLTETYNYSFEPTAYAQIMGLNKQPHLVLSNPPAPELANLRVSLLPGLLSNLIANRTVFQKNAGRKESGLFETGNVFRPASESDTSSSRVPGVQEEVHIAGALVGTVPTSEAIIQAIADAFSVEEEIVGKTGSVKKLESVQQSKLKYRLPVTVFEFNLSELVLHAGEKNVPLPRDFEEASHASQAMQFIPYSKYPAVDRDISMLVAPSTSPENVQEIIERVGGELVTDVDLFDEYEPDNQDQKGLAFHIEYQAADRTLTDPEVNKIHASIILALEAEIKAQIR